MSKKHNCYNNKMIHIKWLDSTYTPGWHNEHKDSNLMCESVGIYVSENKEAVKIALSSGGYKGSYADYLEIPKCCITNKRWIK